MTIAVFVKQTFDTPDGKIVLADVTMDSSYPSPGGEVVTPAQLGLSGINHVVVGSPPLGGFAAGWDPSTNAISLWVSTTGADTPLIELANTESAATAIVPVCALGY